jgi:hypothetical protein
MGDALPFGKVGQEPPHPIGVAGLRPVRVVASSSENRRAAWSKIGSFDAGRMRNRRTQRTQCRAARSLTSCAFNRNCPNYPAIRRPDCPSSLARSSPDATGPSPRPRSRTRGRPHPPTADAACEVTADLPRLGRRRQSGGFDSREIPQAPVRAGLDPQRRRRQDARIGQQAGGWASAVRAVGIAKHAGGLEDVIRAREAGGANDVPEKRMGDADVSRVQWRYTSPQHAGGRGSS